METPTAEQILKHPAPDEVPSVTKFVEEIMLRRQTALIRDNLRRNGEGSETSNPEIVTLHLTKDQADVLAHLIFRHIGSLASRTVSGPPAIKNANRIISWTTLAKGLIKE